MEGFKKMGKMQSGMPCYAKGGKVKKMAGGGEMINPVVNMAVKRALKKAPMPATGGTASQGMPAPAKASARAMPALAKPNAPAVGAPQGMPRPVGRARPATPAMGALKKGGEVESKGEHYSEMKKMSKLDKEIRNESEEVGRVKARLNKHESMEASKAHKGLKTGGVANAQGGYKTGGVAKSNAGGYKTGGVADSNAGGYKKGGKAMEPKFKRGGKC